MQSGSVSSNVLFREAPMVAQEDGLTDLLRRGYKTRSIAGLIDELLPENQGQLPIVKACYEFTTSQTPIICLLVDLAKNPHHEISMTTFFNFYLDYMSLLHNRYKQNMNDPFVLKEWRQNGPYGSGKNAYFEIHSNPLSRALVSDLAGFLDIQRIIDCVDHLVSLGADPTQPFFHMTEFTDNVETRYLSTEVDNAERFNQCNGRSLVYVALKVCKSVALAAALMKHGATIDDSPTFFTDAMHALNNQDQIRELIALFESHFPKDVIKSMSAPDSSGRTPLHYVAMMPPKKDEDKLYAARYLQSELGLSLGPDNHGITPRQHAFNYRYDAYDPSNPTHQSRHRLAGQKMIDELDRLQNIEQASLVHSALRNSGLSSEIRGAIAERVYGPHGASSLESYGRNERKALDRLRNSAQHPERMSLA
jgi:hypothetical protein